MSEVCVSNNINWKFIHHRLFTWEEAGIKSCKFHLKRVIGETLLTFEELATVLTWIEIYLNLHPVCQLPVTAADLQPLTLF